MKESSRSSSPQRKVVVSAVSTVSRAPADIPATEWCPAKDCKSRLTPQHWEEKHEELVTSFICPVLDCGMYKQNWYGVMKHLENQHEMAMTKEVSETLEDMLQFCELRPNVNLKKSFVPPSCKRPFPLPSLPSKARPYSQKRYVASLLETHMKDSAFKDMCRIILRPARELSDGLVAAPEVPVAGVVSSGVAASVVVAASDVVAASGVASAAVMPGVTVPGVPAVLPSSSPGITLEGREAMAKQDKEEAEKDMKELTDKLKAATERRNVARELQQSAREERYQRLRDELQKFKGGLVIANEGAQDSEDSAVKTVKDLRNISVSRAVLLIPADDGSTTVKFVSRDIVKAAASTPAAADSDSV